MSNSDEERLLGMPPPWVRHPGFSPGDGFWRQSGEVWLKNVWRPFWDGLAPEDQRRYLERHPPPQAWRDYYLDPSFEEWLSSADDP